MVGKKGNLSASEEYGSLARELLRKYLDTKSTVDTTFVIRFENGMMDDEVLNIYSNIVVNGVVYKHVKFVDTHYHTKS